MNVNHVAASLADAQQNGKNPLANELRGQLATEFGHQRGWTITKTPLYGIGQLLRRGKMRNDLDRHEQIEGIDHAVWYRNAKKELIGVVTQPYGPISCHDPRLKITELDYPKWHDPNNKKLYIYLIEPTASQSLSADEVRAYREIHERLKYRPDKHIPISLVKSARRVIEEWKDSELKEKLIPQLVALTLNP